MTNTATLALTLLAMAALDAYFVAEQKPPEVPPERLYTNAVNELPSSRQYVPGSGAPSSERARRLFQLWGEWRLGHVGARQIVLYDPGADAARIFPTPAWLAENPEPLNLLDPHR